MSTGSKMPPTVYQAQQRPGFHPAQARGAAVVQPKLAATSASRHQPASPPVYRPQLAPKVLQAKMPAAHQPLKQMNRGSAAPPVYRPQPMPKVLQPKIASNQQSRASDSPRQPVAPPVYRPQPPARCMQPKMASVQPQRPSTQGKPPAAPPAYRPGAVPHVLRQHNSSSQTQALRQPTPHPHGGAVAVQRATMAMSVQAANRPSAAKSLRGVAQPQSRKYLPHQSARVIQRMETEMTTIVPSHVPVSTPMNFSGETVKTAGGTWEATEYYAKPGVKDPSARGAHMKLKFTPEEPVNATLIGLVQTVRPVKNKNYFYLNPTVAYRSANGVSIDQEHQSRSPLYADDPAQSGATLGSTPLTVGAGEHGYRYKNHLDVWQVKAAWLEDNPQMRGVNDISGQLFETTALAVAGVDKGKYYGSVSWGWTWEPGGEVEIEHLQVVAYGNASETFGLAAKMWNAMPTSQKETTQQLPPVPPPISAPIKHKTPFESIDNDQL